MTEHPILYKADMVLAYLANRKMMTRRLALDNSGRPSKWTRVTPGDVLWGRETWAHKGYGLSRRVCQPEAVNDDLVIKYMADGAVSYLAGDIDKYFTPSFKDRVSIHMPRSFSRITQTVTEVRIERLQDITEEDAYAEGFDRRFPHPLPHKTKQARYWYRELWERIHGPGSWGSNPQVVVLSYPRYSDEAQP